LPYGRFSLSTTEESSWIITHIKRHRNTIPSRRRTLRQTRIRRRVHLEASNEAAESCKPMACTQVHGVILSAAASRRPTTTRHLLGSIKSLPESSSNCSATVTNTWLRHRSPKSDRSKTDQHHKDDAVRTTYSNHLPRRNDHHREERRRDNRDHLHDDSSSA